MDDIKEIVEEATKEAYQLDKRFGQNSKVQIFTNLRGEIDYLCLKIPKICPLDIPSYIQ